MEDVTAILAAPREFARRYENLEAQLEVRDSTIATLEKALAAVTSERDAARAEVARLTAALGAIEFIDYGNGLVLCPRCGFRKIMGHGAGCSLNAALRGDTAPAQPAGTKVVSLNSLNKCDKCGHLMVDHDRTDDGRRICMRLGCDCIDTAPATGRE